MYNNINSQAWIHITPQNHKHNKHPLQEIHHNHLNTNIKTYPNQNDQDPQNQTKPTTKSQPQTKNNKGKKDKD